LNTVDCSALSIGHRPRPSAGCSVPAVLNADDVV
jgi:hypothetical protein